MITPELQQRLAEVFEVVFGLPQTSFHSELNTDHVANWDSFRHLKLIVALENEFKCKIRARDMSRLRSVSEIAAVLAQADGRTP